MTNRERVRAFFKAHSAPAAPVPEDTDIGDLATFRVPGNIWVLGTVVALTAEAVTMEVNDKWGIGRVTIPWDNLEDYERLCRGSERSGVRVIPSE